MSGIGKTQAVIKFINNYGGEYDFINWFDAEDSSSLKNQFLILAIESGISTELKIDDENLKIKNILSKVNMCLKKYNKVLFIFDNAVNYESIKNYLPNIGHIIITSIDKNWRIANYEHGIDIFKREESIEFILKYTNEDNINAANELADELEDYPLALEQALAYIVNSPIINIRCYLDKFREYNIDEVKQNKYFFEETDTPEFYNKKLGTAWVMTFERISTYCKSAVDIMNLCAFLSPDRIPLELFIENKSILLHEFRCFEEFKDNFDDEFQKKLIFGCLYRYSVINWDTSTSSLKIHRIIQFLIRAMLKKQKNNLIYETVAANMLKNVFEFRKNDSLSWSKCEKYLPHIIFSINYNKGIEEDACLDIVINLYINLGRYYNNLRVVNEAEKYLKKALEIVENKIKEHNNCYMMEICYELHQVCFFESRFLRSKKYIDKACVISEGIYGENDERICKFLISKGTLLQVLEKNIEAKIIFERALNIDERVFGNESEEFSRDLIFLGSELRNLGELDIAKNYFDRALSIDKNLHGDEHQDVGRDLNNIAIWYQTKQDYKNSLKYHQESLVIFEKIYSNKHPKVAIGLEGIGNSFLMLGKFNKAKDYFQRAMKINKNNYGEINREYARGQMNLAGALLSLKEYDRAIKLFKQALVTSGRIYGENSLRYKQYLQMFMIFMNNVPKRYKK